MAIAKNELETVLKTSFPNAEIHLEDTVGDEDHYHLTIKDPSFNDISIISQHKLVKEALKDLLHSKLHSISVKTMRS
ncbi:MAG: BolA/IbaG family iron-sulfur metabolism protein [Rickettsiaceae bacterium]|nr:BolA/IbaG family iron-sulfur metabolism protein [Rickettsiaceae bacterium]